MAGFGTGGTAIDLATPSLAGDMRARDLALVRRAYRMRVLGWGLGALAIAAVLRDNGAAWPVWLLLLGNGYVWPHVAAWLARRSRDPRTVEMRSMLVDSACGGAWIALIEFNLLPSALILVMLAVDKIGVGGWRFLARSVAAQAVACALTSALLGFPLQPRTTMTQIAWALPFLFAYPLALSSALHEMARRIARQNRELERLNRIDALTGLPNRRHWEEAAAHELARYLRTRRPSALMLIDVDNFKEVNDRHGHATGDEVLRCIAQVLRAATREIDMPARYGGDEFAVLLTETNLRGACEVGERVRTMFLAMRSREAAAQHCTLSIGIADADRLLVAVDDWVRRADAAMYRAKAAGRNRVEIDAASAREHGA